MTPDELRDKIRRRAGIRQRRVPVRIVEHERMLPPSIRRIKRNSERREVVVSTEWLRLKEPKLWAAYMAGRLLSLPDRLTITTLKEIA